MWCSGDWPAGWLVGSVVVHLSSLNLGPWFSCTNVMESTTLPFYKWKQLLNNLPFKRINSTFASDKKSNWMWLPLSMVNRETPYSDSLSALHSRTNSLKPSNSSAHPWKAQSITRPCLRLLPVYYRRASDNVDRCSWIDVVLVGCVINIVVVDWPRSFVTMFMAPECNVHAILIEHIFQSVFPVA